MSLSLRYKGDYETLFSILEDVSQKIENIEVEKRDNYVTFYVSPPNKLRYLYHFLNHSNVKGVDTSSIEMKLYYYLGNMRSSYFHNVNLYNDYRDKSLVNMVVEIPQYNTLKMEISKEEEYNPIIPDIKDGKKRHVNYRALGSKNRGYPFTYGALPQTWENKNKKDERTNLVGDGDPIDVFDITNTKRMVGDIIKVRILGAIAMIDQGETDWKVIATQDEYENIEEVPQRVLNTIVDFLRNYKTVEGKGQNTFADRMIWNKDEAIEIVKECHHEWFHMVNEGDDGIETKVVDY